MLEPNYSFTIPSLFDDIPLDCRLFHPKDLASILNRTSGGTERNLRGAIVAHPYAPLGGCYDDAVVLAVTESLVKKGYLVATFNFRGAGSSQGKTSWSGIAEIEDYTTLVGLMAFYLAKLQAQDETESFSPLSHKPNLDFEGAVRYKHLNELTLVGYSFGALVLARLPPTRAIIQRFESAEKGTTPAEVFLRARTLAKQTRQIIESKSQSSSSRGQKLSAEDSGLPNNPTAHAATSPVTVGGEETDPSERRSSRDSRHSIDTVRELPRRIKTRIRRLSGNNADKSPHTSHESTSSARLSGLEVSVSTRYLLISPVLLPFTTALAPPGIPPLSMVTGRTVASASSGFWQLDMTTLLLFGSADTFTNTDKCRQWAERLARDASGRLRWSEIRGAGHFWREEGAMNSLQDAITNWSDATVE